MNEHAQDEAIEGLDSLPKEYEAVVLESLEQGEAIVPPKPDVPTPTKKSRAKKKTADQDDDTSNGKLNSKKEARKGKSKQANVDKRFGTREATSEDTSRIVKVEDADQEPGIRERIAKDNLKKRKMMVDANEATTTGQVTLKEKTRKRRKQNAEDGSPGSKVTGGEFAVPAQAPKKLGTGNNEYIPTAERRTLENRIGEGSIDHTSSVGDTITFPLRRSARQAARAGDAAEGQAQSATSGRSDPDRKNTAAPIHKVDENATVDMAEATPENNQMRSATAAGNAATEDRKGKAKVTISKKKRDRKAAVAAANKAEDNILDKDGGALSKKTTNVDEDVSMANIAELREFMRKNTLPRRLPRY
jgi:hypothetical protein